MLIDYKKANIYQADESILKNVDFHVDEEQFVYVIGKVGSGKSSLLKSFYCEVDFDKTDAEKAEVLERNLLTLKRKDIPALRREMGIIFQDFQLLHDRSVKQNLQFVLKATGWKSHKEIDQRILKVLEAVGMQDKSNRLPHELSGGEQQRIAIARALLNQPKIIIADEPTGNLDPDTAEKIVGLLYEISHSGTSVVISTHNLAMINKFPGRVYKCSEHTLKDITKEYDNQ
ncbi:ATP-binding cassette domain-containing protein [Prevotella sp.]|uniref:cell division ATP-binding protein FtsE n=1 Tax=uncultured Prevotella sp. TaxID=159272 RepID=UPI0025D3D4A1|nr:ATP-binding cassette domain-containing protein [Prevotella sp.]MCI7119698.1 ATP-binding cassette domain-containing protein [Prevotella sp.]